MQTLSSRFKFFSWLRMTKFTDAATSEWQEYTQTLMVSAEFTLQHEEQNAGKLVCLLTLHLGQWVEQNKSAFKRKRIHLNAHKSLRVMGRKSPGRKSSASKKSVFSSGVLSDKVKDDVVPWSVMIQETTFALSRWGHRGLSVTFEVIFHILLFAGTSKHLLACLFKSEKCWNVLVHWDVVNSNGPLFLAQRRCFKNSGRAQRWNNLRPVNVLSQLVTILFYNLSELY